MGFFCFFFTFLHLQSSNSERKHFLTVLIIVFKAESCIENPVVYIIYTIFSTVHMRDAQ